MIGILDSGLGGLSVLRELHTVLPTTSFHYIGDSAWCPYGTKTYAEIQSRVSELTDYLINHGAELIVIACNSATIACVEQLRTQYPLPIVGMEPGIKPASQLTRSGVIGVLATEASLAGEKFHRLIATHTTGMRVITRPCPKFVELVERGILEGAEVENAIREYAEPMIDAGADTLVLGCTHYPFLKPVIARLYPNIILVDTGKAVATHVVRCLENNDFPKRETTYSSRFSTTGDAKHASKLLQQLCPIFTEKKFLPFAI